MSYPLGPRFNPVAKTQGERLAIYPTRQSYLMHVRLCPEIIESLQRKTAEGPENAAGDEGNAFQGSIAANLRRTPQTPNSQRKGPLGMAHVLRGKAPSTTALPPKGSYSLLTAAMGQVNATVPYDATANDAIQAIFDQIGYGDRPVEDFVILQAFADYAPDYSSVPLYGDGQPVRLALRFPYYVYVTISPYVRERDNLVERREPLGRAKIENERSAFRQFAHGYAQILHKMAKTYHSLFENEMRTRIMKKMQERQHFFTMMLFQLLNTESTERYLLKYEERCEWERFMLLWDATKQHQAFADEQFAQFMVERDAMLRQFNRHKSEMQLLATLNARIVGLRDGIQKLLEVLSAKVRNMYTESRLLSNFLASNEIGMHQMDFQVLRQLAGRERNPGMYPEGLPSAINAIAINQDAFTCARYDGGQYPLMAVDDRQPTVM